MADAPTRGWMRPRVVGPLLLALLLAMILLTPTPPEQRGALTSYSAAAGGARALHDAARRLGWRVERRTTPFTRVPDSTAVYAVLEPPVAFTSGEAHRLLEAVRAGAGLLLVVQPRSALADSLGLRRSAGGGRLPLAPAGLCPDSLNRTGLITWPDRRVHSWWLRRVPAGARVFASVTPDAGALDVDATGDEDEDEDGDDAEEEEDAAPDTATARPPREEQLSGRPAIVGVPLGRGRVVAVADPDVLRNDVLRVCRWNAGQLALQALEWLGEGPGRRLVFDEYHHGYGTHADPLGASARALVVTPLGRLALQVAAAGLVLLAALGIRPVAPAARRPIERRSPLEHVGALARAYEQVGASRLAARRLVRGLRRRHGGGWRGVGAPSGGDADAEFLHQVAARRPAAADDVRRLARALDTATPRDELSELGAAAARIERLLRPELSPTPPR